MVKTCAHGLCSSDSRKTTSEMEGVYFVPFPKPKRHLLKCKKWISACNRIGFGLEKITKDTYVCSKHFMGGKGPTTEYPDPIFATSDHYGECKEKYGNRKKLATDDDVEKSESGFPKKNQSKDVIYTIVVLSHESEVRNTTRNTNVAKLELTLNTIYEVVKPPIGWATMLNEDNLVYMKFENGNQVLTLTIYETLLTEFSVLGFPLSKCHNEYEIISKEIMCENGVKELFMALNPYNVCCGNNDDKFVNMYLSKPPNTFKKANFVIITKSIHHKECELLITTQRCRNCQILRMTLRKSHNFLLKEKPVIPNPHCNLRYLTREQLMNRVKAREIQLDLYERKLRKLDNSNSET